METALKIENINKYFGKRHILKDLSFETYCGEVFGFLGPNGAGKTTLIKLIVGLLKNDSGSIFVCGCDASKKFEQAMTNIGAIVENPEFYGYMTGLQNLKQYARMRKNIPDSRIDEVVEIVGLKNRINEKVSKYSLGMRQRLGLAQAILHNPKVLILDEPTNGLDPSGIKSLRDILKNLAHTQNVCVLVSSHMMSEMELMCDRVAIISNGSLISIQSVDELILSTDGKTSSFTYEVNNCELSSEIITNAFSDASVTITDKNTFELTLITDSPFETVADINVLLIKNNIRLYSVSKCNSRSLEDAFMELTKEGGTQIV